MRRAVIIVPGIVVVIMNDRTGLIAVGRKDVHRRLEVMVDHARLKLQRGQAGNTAGGKAGDRAGLHAGLAAGVLHRCAEVVGNVDHAHVGLGVVGFGFAINRHLRFSFRDIPDNGHTGSYSALPHDEAASDG